MAVTPAPRVSSAASCTFRCPRLQQAPAPAGASGKALGASTTARVAILRQGKAREGQQADRIIRLLDMIEFPLLAFHLANSELQKLHLEHVGGQWAQVAWARNTECTSAMESRAGVTMRERWTPDGISSPLHGSCRARHSSGVHSLAMSDLSPAPQFGALASSCWRVQAPVLLVRD